MKQIKDCCFAVSLFAGLALAGALRADESVAKWFRPPEVVLADATCVSDTNAFTCGSAPISCVHDGMIYAPYLTARNGHGEQHKIIALSVFPADEPYLARSYVIAEAGVAGPAADCTQVIDPFSVWRDGKVRVYFLANAEHYRFCDWDPETHTVGEGSPVKCVWAGAETNELTSAPLAGYLTAKECTGFNLNADASEHLICTAKPAWHDGAFYGTVTSGSSQPVVFRCADGETFEFVGVVPVIGQYECQIAWLGDRLYALVRSAAGGLNFWTSDDGGATWAIFESISMSATRPQLLAWRDKLLVGYSEENVTPNLIRGGRNNMRLMVGTAAYGHFHLFEQAFRVVDPIGFVYYDLVPCDDGLYVLWSNSSVYPDLGGTLSGKDAIFASRLSVWGDAPSVIAWEHDGIKLRVTVRSGSIGPAGAHLVLAWGETDGGDAPDSWENHADLGVVTDAGGSWLVDPAKFGIPEHCRLCVIAVPAYELVESITSSGTQYLDTELFHAQDDVVALDLRMDSFHESLNAEIYGARNDGSGAVSVEAFSGYGNKKPLTIVDFCNTATSRLRVDHGDTFDAIQGRRLKMRLGADGCRIRTDDGVINATGGAYSGSPFVLTKSAWVFGLNGAGWVRHPGMTLYSLDVNRGGTPLRQYRPVRFLSGAAGMCDLLTGQQLLNCGSGDFATGEATNLVVDCSRSVARSNVGDWSVDYGAISAVLTDYSGAYDGEKHTLTLSIAYPEGDGAGCTVRWAWNGAPDETDFTHDAPCSYSLPGTYTNVVCVTDDEGVLVPFVATGIVSIVSRSVMAIPVQGGLDLEVSSAAIGTTNAALVLAWDKEDRGETISAWARRAKVVGMLDPTGGTFRVDAAALGMVNGDRCRAFVAPSCQILTYLGATGTQYLDTGVAHRNDDVVELDLTMTEQPTKGGLNAMVYGSRDDGDGAKAVEVFQGYAKGTSEATTYADFRFANDADCRMVAAMGYTTFEPFFNRPFTIRLGAAGSRIDFADGQFSAHSASGWGSTSFLCLKTAHVFSVNGAGWACHPGLRVHDIRIARAGAPFRHFVPAYDEKGEAGLLDILEGDFLENRGTGKFVCGEMTNTYVRIESPMGISPPVTVSLTGDACDGTVTGWQGEYDGRPHTASIRVNYPETGACVRWAWTDAPEAADFTHEGPEECVEPGCYTNVVRITDEAGLLEAWVGTGVVQITYSVMARYKGSAFVVSVASGVASDGDALVMAWSDKDEGSTKLNDWPHSSVLATLSSAGGEFTVGSKLQRQLGVPKGAVCRFFAMPSCELLEYAESTSSIQHLDLRFALSSDYTAIVEAEVPPDAAVSSAFGIFGARKSHNMQNFSVGADQNCAYADNNNCGNDDRGLYQAKSTPLVKGSRYRFLVGSPCSASVGGTVTTAERSWTDTRFSTEGTAWLFGINQGGRQAFTASTGVRVYSCIVSNGVPALVCDARPVRNLNGEVCLYDSVTDEFLLKEGSGELRAGPHVGYQPLLGESPRAVSLPIVVRRPAGLCIFFGCAAASNLVK